MPKIGAHVSAAVSLEKSFDKAKLIGAECTQIFISPPQQWFQTKHDDSEIERFKKATAESGIGANFIHGTYLVNLGTQNEDHLTKSIDWLTFALDISDKLGTRGVIFHPGSHKGVGFDQILKQIEFALKKVFEKTRSTKTFLILETSAGAGNVIGDKFSELGQILKAVDHPRLKICLDTQHVFVAGYSIHEKLGLEEVLEEFDFEIGLNNLVAIHANDSKVEFGTNRDRHENIGEGFIGKETFANMINHPKLAEIPFILEVPGFEKSGPDKQNIDLLKGLRK